MYQKKEKQLDGFTLIEFLLYSVIVTMIIGALVLTGINVIESRAKIEVVEEVNHNGRITTNAVTRHIREAKDINHPSPGSTGSYLSLAMPSLANSPTVFQVSGNGDMTIKRGTGGEKSIISDAVRVSNILFTNTSANGIKTVRVEIEIEYTGPVGSEQDNFTKKFYATETVRVTGEGTFGE